MLYAVAYAWSVQRGCFKIGCRPRWRASPEKVGQREGWGVDTIFFLPKKKVSIFTYGVYGVSGGGGGYRRTWPTSLTSKQAWKYKTSKQTKRSHSFLRSQIMGCLNPPPPPPPPPTYAPDVICTGADPGFLDRGGATMYAQRTSRAPEGEARIAEV